MKYDYLLHEVSLTDQEYELYEELTAKIVAMGFMAKDKGEAGSESKQYEILLFRRRAVLENASGKIPVLRSLVGEMPNGVQRTLIYASGKKPPIDEYERQISQVNDMLSELGIVSHQFTSGENQHVNWSGHPTNFRRGRLPGFDGYEGA